MTIDLNIPPTPVPVMASTLVELLRWRAEQHPDRLAYTFLHDGTAGAIPQTYRELDQRARVIGAALQQMEAAGSHALLLYPPGLDYIAAFIGCLYAGVVAVPAYPPQLNRPMPRLEAIAHDSQATVALTTSQILHNVEARLAATPQLQRLQWVATDQLADALADRWHCPDLGGDDLALLQYTSGSTATPKGVMLSHRNLLSNLGLIQQGFGTTSDSRGVFWLPPYHDMGLIGGLLQTLYCGGSSTLFSPIAFLQRPWRWLQAISDTQATISGGPNFAYELCVNKITPEQRARLDLHSWQVAFNGAEPIRSETIERFAAMFGPCGFRREAFYPCYGLAEATLLVCGGARNEAPIARTFQAAPLAQNQVVSAPGLTEQDSRSLVSCGRQLQAIAIVEPATCVRCQPDQVGEIWVAGPSVAQGYWNQPAATREAFQAALAQTGEGPFLRTGDLGFVHDGELFVTGRLKDLIIIRGRNYYPHDIELSVEQCHPALRINAGAAFSVEAEHEERLVVVQEIDRRHRDVDVAEVAEAIRQAVAEEHNLQVYAVALIKTGSIPKTSSGKIQRRACRAQFLSNTLDLIGPPVLASSPTNEAACAPVEQDAGLETTLQRLVAQVLKLAPTQVDQHSPLTTMGLDSLMAVELQHMLENELGVQLPLADFVSGATIAEITATILAQLDDHPNMLPTPSAHEAATTAPLSYGQRALWFLYRLAPQSGAYNIANAVRMRMDLDVSALRQAFQMLAQRHPTLRSTFTVVDGEPIQQIQQPGTLWFQHEDAGQWSEHQLQQHLAEEAERPFDLEHGPVLRVRLFTRSAQEHILLATAHHIVVDLWSFSVLIKELDALYHALTTGTPAALQPLPLHYFDYVNTQQKLLSGSAGEELWRYWRHQLGGELPTLNLPTDRPRPPVQTYRGATQHGLISAEVTQEFKALSACHNTTLFTTLLAAFQVLLYRYTDQAEILVGSPSVGRTRAELAGVVGYFVNPLVLRANCGGNPSFTAFLEQIRQTVLAAFTHQEYPFTLLTERLQPSRDASRSPLFQTMFVLQKAPMLQGLAALAMGEAGAQLDLTALHLESVALERRTAQFDLSLIMVEIEGQLEARFEYNSDLFDAATISRMLAHFQALLAQIVAEPTRAIATIPLYTPAEQQLVSSWNATQQAYHAACVHHLFEAQATRTPDALAVIFPGAHERVQQLSYRELDIAANRLAHYLQDLGVGPESLVGICIERSPELLVGLLGILKAGAAYVSLDPAYPCERLNFILEDTGASILLTDQRLARAIDNQSVRLVCLDADRVVIAESSATTPQSSVTPDHLAYVIYTSGSTGTPKGVAVVHRSVANLIDWHQRTFDVAEQDRTTQLASPAFDAMAWEIWPALSAGACIVIPDDETRISAERLQSWLWTHAITMSFVPTPIAEQLLALNWAEPSVLRTLLTGGDRLRSAPSNTLPFTLVNNYGPTESTVVATSGSVPPDTSNTPPPIGRPIGNTQIYLLSSQLQPVPVGVPGEVYIGGDGLARGYLNRPDLTAERFVPHPFSGWPQGAPGSRLYRTGDLARYRSDGTLEFLGRIDHQVKLRGFRIELGEIEALLAQHPLVREAVVLVREADGADQRLVAYVVENKEQENNGAKADGFSILCSPQELRHFLAQQLPEYMLPSAYVALRELPLTPNGKVDRRALLAVELPQLDSEHTMSRTPTEELVAGVWRELLSLERVGTQDNFFELGGHSLLATQVVSRLRQIFAVELPVRALFEAPTVAGLSRRIEQARQGEAVSPIVPASRAADLPLSFAQERLWFLNQLDPGSATYNLAYYVQLQGSLDVSALERSLNALIQRHEVLRTAFPSMAGQPVQRILPRVSLMLPSVDFNRLTPTERHSAQRQLIESESKQPFNLQDDALLRAKLVRLADDEHLLLLTMHHMVVDGWSQGVFTEELSKLYTAFKLDRQPQLAELPIQYADYALWQRQWLSGDVLAQQVAYWRQQLQPDGVQLPALDLPTDRPRPAIRTVNGATIAVDLHADLTAALKSLSRGEGATLFMTLLAAFQVLLYRYTGQRDFGVGSPIANRARAELEGLIGCFINMLVLRARITEGSSFRDLLRSVIETALQAYAHQDLPFEKLVEELHLERDPSRSPLFDVMFVLQNTPTPRLDLPDIKITPLDVSNDTAKYDLTLTLAETADRLSGTFEYNSDLFEAVTIARMAEHFQTLLMAIVAAPDRRVADLPLLGDDERQRMLYDWNATAAPYPADTPIHRLFEAQVEQRPDAVAVVFQDRRLSYRELNGQANQLAHHLRSLGVTADSLVGIYMERSLDMVVGLLATLKAGAAYLPLDPAYPRERIAFMIEDARVPVLLTQQRLIGQMPRHHAEVVVVDAAWLLIARSSNRNMNTAVAADNLAYVIYTSGSTGLPKGVMVGQQNVINFFTAIDQRIGSDPGIWLAVTSISFDISVLELLWTLTRGFQVIVQAEQARTRRTAAPSGEQNGKPIDLSVFDDTGYSLAEQIVRHQVTHFQCTPSLARMLTMDLGGMDALCSLRKLMLGGEALPPALARQLSALGVGEIHNMYGPTETTIWSATHRLGTIDQTLPIGRPVANTAIYILDRQLQPVPVGVPGEMYIGGLGVVRGYLNRPDLTAERFVPHPFGLQPGERLYKTGDLACYWPDGTIEFLGRLDHQVKLHGHRIELGEIEAALCGHPAIDEVVVVMRQDELDSAGQREQRLVAYVVPQRTGADPLHPKLSPGEQAGLAAQHHTLPNGKVIADLSDHQAHATQSQVSASELRELLKERLPEYMIPAAFVTLPTLPLTPNGKVDRKALPAPQLKDPELDGIFVAPRTPAEEVIAGIWSAVLKVERVGIHANFFTLGGHSLIATQMMSRIRDALQVELPLRVLFDTPTVAALARSVEAAQCRVHPPMTAIESISRDQPLPLSFAQQRLWFLDQLQPDTAAYNIPAAIQIRGALQVTALRRSLNMIIQRHEALRTVFNEVSGDPVQVIMPNMELPLLVVDLSDRSEIEQKRVVLHHRTDEAQMPFDLQHGPLIRTRLLRLDEREHLLLLTVHHIVADGWSVGIFLHELATLYAAYGQDAPVDPASLPPPLPIQYADFALWQRAWLASGVLERQLAYWQQQLADVSPVLDLSTDRPRPVVSSFRGAAHTMLLPPELVTPLKTLSQRTSTTLFMTLLAAWGALLARWSGQDDLVVGVPIANRMRAEVEPLIGCFVNTLALRLRMIGQPTFADLLHQVRSVTLEAYAHQDLPFERLVEALAPRRDTGHTPLFQVMFILQNTPLEPIQLPDLTLEPLHLDIGIAKFDLTLELYEHGDGLAGWIEYSTDLFDAATISRLAGHFRRILEAVAADPTQRVADLPLLTMAERRQLLLEWNPPSGVVAQPATIHELIEAQALSTPDAVAVICNERALTYREVNERANQVAHYLRGQGVGVALHESRIGVYLEGSLDLVVGLLGILKAGGAYLPLDPSYPAERLACMLADAQPTVVLTHQHLRDTLPDHRAQVVCLDADWELIGQERIDDPASGTTGAHVAYIIYTSGSTGRPKGVLVPHRAVVNHSRAVAQHYALQPADRVLQFASLSFDVAAEELFPTLAVGATVVVCPQEIRASLAELLAFADRERLTVLNLPTSLWHEWVVALTYMSLPRPAALRLLVVGSEAVSPERLEQWQQLHAGRVRLLNAYGPTEATITATIYEPQAGWTAQGMASVPIGRPLANVQTYILDAHGQPVPIGVPGELYIGGVGVAWGYLHHPVLTAERFVPDPFSGQPGARLYRTGDLVRYHSDGTIAFLGRIDHQIKLRGFRIELGEIETVLAQHPAVRQAIVVVREDTLPAGGHPNKYLIAYIVGDQETPPVSGEIRRFLQATLPNHMIPAAFVTLPALPLTPNGKVDRKALPVPELPAESDAALLPVNPIEDVLTSIWAAVLGREHLSRHANFFDLGGHSLLATQIIARVRDAFQVEIPLRSLFEEPTIAAMAERVAAARQSGHDLDALLLQPMAGEGPLPLSFAQQRLWFLEQLTPGTAVHTVPGAVRIQGPLSVAALEQSLNSIIERHAVLRTTFAVVAGQPVQKIAAQLWIQTEVEDLRHLTPAAQIEALQHVIAQEHAHGFDLARGPLLRTRLIQTADREHVLLVTMHHIITDATSLEIFIREIGQLYTAHATHSAHTLPPLPIQYADYAVWQRQWVQGAVLEKLLAYWKHQLRGPLPTLSLPTDRPRPLQPSFRGAHHRFDLPAELKTKLVSLSQHAGATMFMTLLGAFKLLLYHYTRQTDLIVGTPTANRTHVETTELIGYFVNALALRTDLSGDPSFVELLGRVREVALGAYAHQEMPFEKVVEAVWSRRPSAISPVFQVVFNFQNEPSPLNIPGLTLTPLEIDNGTTKYDLTLYMHETKRALTGSFTYNTDLFDAATITRMQQQFVRLLQIIVVTPHALLSACIAELSEVERNTRIMQQRESKESGLRKLGRVERKNVSISHDSLVKHDYLELSHSFPLVIRPAVDDVDLVDWAKTHLDLIETELLKHGAILFRDFKISTVPVFEQVALTIVPELVNYVEGSSPRIMVGNKVYTSTEYPPEYVVSMHNELSYAHRWPSRIFFFCATAAQQGGETPIADSRKVFELLDPAIKERFLRKGVKYVRNLHGDQGMGLSWQTVFETSDRSVVEAYCRAGEIDFRWKEDGGLWTSQVRPAAIRHPKTGQMIWFNQVDQWHPSNLGGQIATALIKTTREEDLPINAYYGDGTPLEAAVLDAIRAAYDQAAVAFPWQAGDVLLVDNMLMAHGRRPFVPPRKVLVVMGMTIGHAEIGEVSV